MTELLKELRKVFLEVASAEYSCYPELYNQKKRLSPLDGHCAIVSYLVYKLLGGELIKGKVNGEPHYWNRLPDGSEVDLTSCQFGGDGFTPLVKGRKIKRIPELTPIPYMIVYGKILEHLQNG